MALLYKYIGYTYIPTYNTMSTTNVDYYVITGIDCTDVDDSPPKEDGEYARIVVKSGVTFGYSKLYDGSCPSEAYEEAEDLYVSCVIEDDEAPEDVVFYRSRRQPNEAMRRIAGGDDLVTVVGNGWAIISAREFPFVDNADKED